MEIKAARSLGDNMEVLNSFFTQLDMGLWSTGLAIFALLIISAFFSGSETALTGASKAILRSMTDKGSKGAKKALELREQNEKLIGSLLLGNNLINIDSV